ncbi:MAG: hypothetical protein ACKO3N_03485 [Verrucomicrobiota bacterium]
MFIDGRPRYWIGWYDRWHLLPLAALVGLLAWLGTRPRLVVRPLPVAPRLEPVAPGLQPTRLETPLAGGSWKSSQTLDVTGRAEPGTRVVLFHAGPGRPEAALAQTVADAAGRFRFALSGLTTGDQTLRAVAYSPDGRFAPSLPVPFSVVAEPGRAARPARAPRRR